MKKALILLLLVACDPADLSDASMTADGDLQDTDFEDAHLEDAVIVDGQVEDAIWADANVLDAGVDANAGDAPNVPDGSVGLTPRSPCPDSNGRCWKTQGAMRCMDFTIDEDFSSGNYNVHRYRSALPANTDVVIDLNARGTWQPALLLINSSTGETLSDGYVGASGITVVSDGRSGSAEVRLRLPAATEVDVVVTSHAVIAADFAAAENIITSANYALSVSADCPRPTGTGTVLGTFWNTYYYKSEEADYNGADDTTLYDASCNPLATVPSAFSDAVCIEGSGLLEDGRVINYARTCSCGRACPTGGTICYTEVDKSRFPWGLGNRNNALVPLVSWAVDRSIIANGTILYVPGWDGVVIPRVGDLGGITHDGCFRADDVGGAINGNHYDFFSGTRAMYLALEGVHPTRTDLEVRINASRCDHLR